MTASKRPVVIVTRTLTESVETHMAEVFDVRCNATDEAFTPVQLLAAAQAAEVLVVTTTDRVDSAFLAGAGPQLRMISSFGVGTDHIDLRAAQARGIVITNTPDVLTDDTADVAMGLILATARRFGEGERMVRSGAWKGFGPTFMLGQCLSGKRLGIIGMGRIGQALARRARAFGMSIHYHNRRPLPPSTESALEATHYQQLEAMLPQVDVVSLNCPATPLTLNILSAARLKLLPRHALVINTARGDCLDESALIGMLEAGEIRGAGLDVYRGEPAINPRLLTLDTVVLLPHVGSATLETRTGMGEKIIRNIQAFFAGVTPPDRVLPAVE